MEISSKLPLKLLPNCLTLVSSFKVPKDKTATKLLFVFGGVQHTHNTEHRTHNTRTHTHTTQTYTEQHQRFAAKYTFNTPTKG